MGPGDPRLGLPEKTIFEPTLVLHNFADVALDATVAVGFRAGGKPTERQLPFSLAPGETQVISLYEHLKDIIPPTEPWASMEIQYSSAHNDLAAALVSVTRNGKHSIRSVLNWVEGSASDGPFWRSDQSHSTLIGMFNTDTESAQVRFSLDYYVGAERRRHVLDTIKIPPRSTYQVDVGAVIAAAKPDGSGDTIPSDITFGGYRVQKIGPRINHILITEELLFNRDSASFLTFYNTCCSFLSTSFSPGSLLGGPGDTGQLDIRALDSCSNTWEDVTSSGIFGTLNAKVATAASGGHANLVAIGQTTLTSQLNYFKKPCFFGCSCTQTQANGSTATTVVPKILLGGSSGTDITGTTQSVVVGQQIVLYASYGSGVSVNSQSWSVPGTIVGGFSTAPTNGGPNPVSLNGQSTTVYWVTAANSQTVTFTLNYGSSQTAKAQATFNIAGPSSPNVTTQLGQAAINPGPVLQFGVPPSVLGIQFSASATQPAGYSGSFVWVQLLTTYVVGLTISSGNQTCNGTGIPGLDNTYPYPSVSGNSSLTNDQPKTSLPSTATEVTLNVNAQMFLMWRPGLSNDIPVPLGSVAWQFFGDAVQNTSNSTWSVQPDSSRSANSFVQSSSYATWTSTFTNGVLTCH
jgi:hypothetical protein